MVMGRGRGKWWRKMTAGMHMGMRGGIGEGERGIISMEKAM